MLFLSTRVIVSQVVLLVIISEGQLVHWGDRGWGHGVSGVHGQVHDGEVLTVTGLWKV